jgi:Reverse transcriptase (RNA-dependent DNA polymerase)
MVIIESYMHICDDRSTKYQNWQWKLLQSLFVKSKRKNRRRHRLKLNNPGSRGMRRLITILSAGHQLMAMSNVINKPSIDIDNAYNHMNDTDSFAIKIDNCCTQTMSGYRSDFIESTIKSISGQQVVGFGKTKSDITHIGTVRWNIYDDSGMFHTLNIPNVYYVPNCEVRLLSPQHWAQELNDSNPKPDGTVCITYRDRVVLKWNQQMYTKTILLEPKHKNIATMWSVGDATKYNKFKNISKRIAMTFDSEVKEEEIPTEDIYQQKSDWDKFVHVCHEGNGIMKISGSEDIEGADSPTGELLEWHLRFGHMPMPRLQSLALEGVIPRRLAKCKVPVCASCMYGKLTKRPWRYRSDASHIEEDVTSPGEVVSVDQMESSTLGLVAQLKGIPTRERYKIATVYVDHASDYTFVHLQTDSSSKQTLISKKEFERHAAGMNVTIKRYHADNGRFVDNAWTNDLKEKNQYMTLCGVNAHHQNGKVEKRIRDLQDLTRSSLLHAQNLWPDAITNNLWPYALRKSAVGLNQIKHKDRETSPLELFSKTKISFKSRDFHTFGCPMYVLQTGSVIKGPKWNSRARLAVYIGPSMNHARSVGLALSLQTGLVSPVFHAKYDDGFSTVSDAYGKYITKSNWQLKCGFQKGVKREAWLDPQTESLTLQGNEQQIDAIDNTHKENNSTVDLPEVPLENNALSNDNQTQYNDMDNHDIVEDIKSESDNIDVDVPTVTTTRSGRRINQPKHLDDYVVYETSVIKFDDTTTAFTDSIDPIALMTSGNQDNFYYHEILREPDKDKFIEAMKEEINMHNVNKNWIPILRSELPKDTKVIPSVWAMRRKRQITDGKIHKWKARLNVDGSKQIKGVNFWETYAPVAQWISIRLILSMAVMKNWKVKTFDFLSKLSLRHLVKPNCSSMCQEVVTLATKTHNGH